MSVENGRWAPGIGDPTIMGWVTVVIYFTVALITLIVAIKSKETDLEKRNDNLFSIKIFWILLSLILVFLGINKQLDLQSLLTQVGKDMALSQGWYEYRRLVQITFIILITFLGIVGLRVLMKTFNNPCISVKMVFIGCIILFVFIVVRAMSFHHMDMFINMDLIGIKMNWLFEVGGLILIGVGATKYLNNKIPLQQTPQK